MTDPIGCTDPPPRPARSALLVHASQKEAEYLFDQQVGYMSQDAQRVWHMDDDTQLVLHALESMR